MTVPAVEPREISDLRDLLQTVPPRAGLPLVGWERLAVVLHELEREEPAVVAVEFDDRPPLSIDWSRRLYWWDMPVQSVGIPPIIMRLRVARGVRLPSVLEHPRPVDGLLWMMGMHVFDGGPADWADPDARYTLERWPDLGSLPHTGAHMRLAALLGTATFTVAELAAAAGCEEPDARRLVTSLDLMGVLTTNAPAATSRGRRSGGGLRQRLGLTPRAVRRPA